MHTQWLLALLDTPKTSHIRHGTYVRVQALSYFRHQKISQELRSSYLLWCLQSPGAFLPYKCQFNLCGRWSSSRLYDGPKGYWGWSMDRIIWAESLTACARTWHETSLLSHLYHAVVTWDWCWACLPAVFLTEVCNNLLGLHSSCSS